MKVVIIGGVAGGAACATRLRRLDENCEITIIEKGEYLSFANCGLPYYIGQEIAHREDLFVASKELFINRFRINVLNNTTALSIDREKKEVKITHQGVESILSYDKLILSPGATPFVPPMYAGIEGAFTLRNVPDVDKIVNYIDKHQVKNAVVVGGGFIGLEVVENLRRRGVSVTLVEMSPQVMAPLDFELAQYVHQELCANGVTLKLATAINKITKKADNYILDLDDATSLETQMLILSIGIRPDSSLAKNCGLKVNERGYIVVNNTMQTNDENIYALGDAVEVCEPVLGGVTSIALAGPAAKEARVVCSSLTGGNYTYRGTMGASIAKVFSLQAASVGFNERVVKQRNINYECIYLHTASHASYYPNSSPVHFKLIYDKNSKQILGAQAVGMDGCDKRIEIISAYMSKHATIDDLAWHEQIYAPPFGSAKDVINFAGFVAQNIEDGLISQVKITDLQEYLDQGAVFLDVRTKEEFDTYHAPEAINIDLNQLRNNLDKLDKEATIVVTCLVGVRGYIACRILAANGFKHVYNLAGGMQSYMINKFKPV